MNLFVSLCVFGFVLVCSTTARNIKETNKLLADLEKDLQDIKQEEKRVADALSSTRKSFKKSVNDEGECQVTENCDNIFSVCVNFTCVCPYGGVFPDCEEGFVCNEHDECNGGNMALGDCVDHKCMCVYDNTVTGCSDSCYNECREDQVCNGDQEGACICKDGLIPVGLDDCEVPCNDDDCDAGFACGDENKCVEQGFSCEVHEDCNGGNMALGDCVDNKCMCVYDTTDTGCSDSCYNECPPNKECNGDGTCVCKDGFVPVAGNECHVPCNDDECGAGFECGDDNECVCKDDEAPEGSCPACEEECAEDEECRPYQIATSEELLWRCQCGEDFVRDEETGVCIEKQCGFDDEDGDDECGENEGCRNFLCKCRYGGEPGQCFDSCGNECRDDQECVDGQCQNVGSQCPAGEMKLKDHCVEDPCLDNERLEIVSTGKRRGLLCVCPKPAFSLTDNGCVSNCPAGCPENEVCGKKGCSCPRNGFYKNREGECTECGCGPNGRCKRNGKCKCNTDFEDVDGECVAVAK